MKRNQVLIATLFFCLQCLVFFSVFRNSLFDIEGLGLIVGSFPNFIGSVAVCLGISIAEGRISYSIFCGVVGVTLYEFLQLFIASRTFDYFDILASVLAGVVVFLFGIVFDKKFPSC